MRTAQSDKRKLYYAPSITAINDEDGEIIATYDTPSQFFASVQSVSDSVTTAQYGDKVSSVMSVFGSTVELTVGTGVWVHAPITGEPDYTVIAAPHHPRERAYTIGKRGVFGG